MEPLMRLVVPNLDGGLLKPLFETVSENFGNLTVRSGFEFLLNPAQNVTGPDEDVPLNSTYGLNTSYVDIGRPILLWYFERLRSQTPLFAVASLLWLTLLACLVGPHAHLMRRAPAGRATRRARRRYPARLKPLFGLMTLVLLLIVIGCVLAVLHWLGKAQFSGMSEEAALHGENGTAASDGVSADGSVSRTRLTATFRQTIDEFDRFVELMIVDTNTTVLTVAREELPNVLQALDTIATFLLEKLAVDFKLAPLLDSFDGFIDLLKLLVESMREVKASRLEVASPLSEFATLVDSARRDIARQVSDACTEAGKSAAAPPVELCDRINTDLALLDVGIDHQQLNTDSSVTIVTLLEKMLKLNFSQVEDQVKSAKGQLYGSLDLVKAEVSKAFDQLAAAVSVQFENALVDAELFRSNLRGSKRDAGFLDAMQVIDRVVLGLSVLLVIGSFVFLAILFLALFVSIRYMLSFRGSPLNRRPSTVGGDDGTDGVDLVYIGRSGLASELPRSPSKRNSSNGNARTSFPLDGPGSFEVLRRRACSEPRNWHSTSLLTSCLLVLAALVYACAVFYAGAEAHMDACRYLTTDAGRAKVDQFLDSLVRERLWPQVETLLAREVKIPLGITVDQVPSELFGPVMRECRNESTTIFQALGLANLINVSRILRSQVVLNELAKGGVMIQDLVRGLNTSNLIPSEVDDLLHKTLPSFAAVIDAENFAPSMAELEKPLLLIGSRWPNLRRDLQQLEASLIQAKSGDHRAVLIRYFADQASALLAEWNGTLTTKLSGLLHHFTTLQTNRRLTNLTLGLAASATALKTTLSDKQYLLSCIQVRYNGTLEAHLETIVNLVKGILDHLQSRVGRCFPLRKVFQVPAEWCHSQIQPLPSTGFYLITACIAFYILVHLLLALMHLIRHQTTEATAATL